jgi:hypothetical protein
MDGVRVSQHASETGCWRISALAPGGRLAPYVNAVYAYEERNTAFRRRRELPDGSAVLIFNLGGELRVECPFGAPQAFAEGDGLYSGCSPSRGVGGMLTRG